MQTVRDAAHAVAAAFFREVAAKVFGIEFRHRRPGTAGKNDRYGNYQDARHEASIAPPSLSRPPSRSQSTASRAWT
jgi:hypothetical protein